MFPRKRCSLNPSDPRPYVSNVSMVELRKVIRAKQTAADEPQVLIQTAKIT
jgi:hypothetical protein